MKKQKKIFEYGTVFRDDGEYNPNLELILYKLGKIWNKSDTNLEEALNMLNTIYVKYFITLPMIDSDIDETTLKQFPRLSDLKYESIAKGTGKDVVVLHDKDIDFYRVENKTVARSLDEAMEEKVVVPSTTIIDADYLYKAMQHGLDLVNDCSSLIVENDGSATLFTTERRVKKEHYMSKKKFPWVPKTSKK